jgi:hypothetical protein
VSDNVTTPPAEAAMTRSTGSVLTVEQLDNLGLALLEMAKEMWLIKDRQMVTESLLREKNLLAELDSYQPGPELSARLAAERDRFLTTLTGILFDDAKVVKPNGRKETLR